MASFVLKNAGDRKVLAASGELTIVEASELKEALLGALDGTSGVDIDLGGVTGADLACLQLIISAWKSAALKGMGIRLSCCSEPFLSAAETAGFELDGLRP